MSDCHEIRYLVTAHEDRVDFAEEEQNSSKEEQDKSRLAARNQIQLDLTKLQTTIKMITAICASIFITTSQ